MSDTALAGLGTAVAAGGRGIGREIAHRRKADGDRLLIFVRDRDRDGDPGARVVDQIVPSDRPLDYNRRNTIRGPIEMCATVHRLTHPVEKI